MSSCPILPTYIPTLHGVVFLGSSYGGTPAWCLKEGPQKSLWCCYPVACSGASSPDRGALHVGGAVVLVHLIGGLCMLGEQWC